MPVKHRVDWIPLSDVPRIVDFETGYKPTRQTIYNWARRGWLKTNGMHPLKTTKPYVMDCLARHRRVR